MHPGLDPAGRALRGIARWSVNAPREGGWREEEVVGQGNGLHPGGQRRERVGRRDAWLVGHPATARADGQVGHLPRALRRGALPGTRIGMGLYPSAPIEAADQRHLGEALSRDACGGAVGVRLRVDLHHLAHVFGRLGPGCDCLPYGRAGVWVGTVRALLVRPRALGLDLPTPDAGCERYPLGYRRDIRTAPAVSTHSRVGAGLVGDRSTILA
jgi:hypothetical protein